jgi:hypothetical protein
MYPKVGEYKRKNVKIGTFPCGKCVFTTSKLHVIEENIKQKRNIQQYSRIL